MQRVRAEMSLERFDSSRKLFDRGFDGRDARLFYMIWNVISLETNVKRSRLNFTVMGHASRHIAEARKASACEEKAVLCPVGPDKTVTKTSLSGKQGGDK